MEGKKHAFFCHDRIVDALIKDKSDYYKLTKTQQPFNLFASHFHTQDENNVKFSLPLKQSYNPNSKQEHM
jgi:hypothetical protein